MTVFSGWKSKSEDGAEIAVKPELGSFKPIWVCDRCENQIYLDEVDCG